MRGLRPSSAGLALLLLSSGSTAAAAQETSGRVADSARSEFFDREVKEARSYLEGWFGTKIVMPPIETAAKADGADDLPGHYQDGVVRLGQETVQKPSELRRVLRHELTHAVIDQKTRGNCPHWLQEGIAQFLDGTDVVATEAWLRREAAPLIPLYRIEGPFREREASSREQAYRESASAVSFLVSRIGRSGLLFLVSRLGEGRPFERALLETGLSYTELEQAWEASLRRAPKAR